MSQRWTSRLRRGALAAALGGTLIAAGCGRRRLEPSGGGDGIGRRASPRREAIAARPPRGRPTSGSTKPIGKPIPTGKKLVFISCGATACEMQGDIVAKGRSRPRLDRHQDRHRRFAPAAAGRVRRGDAQGRRRDHPQRRRPRDPRPSRSRRPRRRASLSRPAARSTRSATGSSTTRARTSRTRRSASTWRPKVIADSKGKAEHALREHLGVRDPQGAGRVVQEACSTSCARTAGPRRSTSRSPRSARTRRTRSSPTCAAIRTSTTSCCRSTTPWRPGCPPR